MQRLWGLALLPVLAPLGAQAATIAELTGKTVVVPYKWTATYSNNGNPLHAMCTGEENFYFSKEGRLFIYRTNIDCNDGTLGGQNDQGRVVTLQKGAQDANKIQGVAATTTVKTLSKDKLEIAGKVRTQSGGGTTDYSLSIKLSVAGSCDLKDLIKIVVKIPNATESFSYDLVGRGCSIVDGKR